MTKPSKTVAAAGTTPFPRGYLYFTAAMTGGAIMIVEILGAKMLSPFVGTSHFVWTAQIAVTLVALACGYYFGGAMADKSQNLARLYHCIGAAALYLLLTVLLAEPVAYACMNFNLAIGTLLTSTVLFFVPLALLAVTGPFLVRVITSSLTGVGGNVGRLTAIGTLGSFAGTMLIGYVMVPLLPNSVAMYLTAAVLLAIVLGYYIVVRRWTGAAVALVLAGACIAAAFGFAKPRAFTRVNEKFVGNSHFGELRVVDRSDGIRYYLNDLLVQNTYDPATRQSASAFTYMLERMALACTTNISSVLCIGMGVGIVPMEFARRGVQVEVVEINPAIVPVASNYFGFEPSRVQLHVGDGRHYLKRCTRQFDAVVLDAFLGDSSPSHLMTREAFAEIKRVLAPGGVLTINSFGELERGRDFFPASLHKTLRSVFKHVRLHSTGHGAVFFAAADHPLDQFLRPPDLDNIHPEAEPEVQAAFRNLVDTDPDHGLVLTDDYNPVEFYDAHHREEIRRNLASAARSL